MEYPRMGGNRVDFAIIKLMSFFYNLLPPPRYIDFPVVGLDLSDRSMKFVELGNTRKGLRLKRFGEKELNPGIIMAGEIKKQDEMVLFLASVFKPLKVRYIIAALPEERVYISAIQLPSTGSKNLREMIEVELSEHIPLPAREAIFDFESLAPSKVIVKGATILEKNPDHLDVIVYAFPRALVERYLNVYVNAGLIPTAFEVETQALARALIPITGVARPVMIVDFGKTRTTFVIVSGKLVRFGATISVAGESLEQAIGKALKVPIVEAERIKKEKGMVKSKDNEAVFNAILPVVSAVGDEIERHILFWNTHAEHIHKSSPEISKIILSGGDANLIGFKEYLTQQLKLQVVQGNPWINIASFEDYIPEIAINKSLGFSVAIGLALRAALGE